MKRREPGGDPREELARMMTAHPQFARATVNLFWSKLMGVGIVEPWDEFDLARQDPKNVPKGWDVQPSHPELLERAGRLFPQEQLQPAQAVLGDLQLERLSAFGALPGRVERQLHEILRAQICPHATAPKNCTMPSRPPPSAPAISAAARQTPSPGRVVNNDDPPPHAAGHEGDAGDRAEPAGELKSFLQAFGQANRGTPARPPQPSPLQPIMLIRSSVVNDRVLAANDSRVQRLLDTYKDNGKVVDELFLGTLAREPSPEETGARAVASWSKNRVEGAQNVQWALLNLVEFLYNF